MNKKTAIVLIITVISPFILRPVLAQNSQSVSFPRLHPEAKALEYYHLGRQNNGYSWIQLAEISLWASGDSSAAGLARIRELAERLNNSNELPSSARERAEFILTYLHRNTLRTYSINQTRVDTIFANGNFNCVSSAVLYMLLCNSAGIDTSGVVTKDHSFVTVHINGENIDVETTNRFGFDPGNRREFHDQFGRLTGFSYVPARNYHDRQTISKIELISLILNNRISELEKQNRYSDAVQLAFDRAALLYGETLTINTGINSRGLLFEDPRIELLNRLFNYGTWLLRTNREEDSLRWAAEIASRFPDDRWQEFILAAVNNRITRFIREGKTNEARNFLEIYKTNILYANYSQLDSIITDAELLRSANQILAAADGDAVVNAIVNARSSGKITERRAAELITFAVQKSAAILCAAPARDWRAAIRYIENALSRFGANRELEQALRTYRNNLAVEYHNRFAAEWNNRNYEAAERILNEGLAEFPADRQLLANRDIVIRHNSR